MKIESVWDYPRPPLLDPFIGHIRIVHQFVILVDTNASLRVLETSHPPVYYLPPEDIDMNKFRQSNRQTYCEFKGKAIYYDLILDKMTLHNVAWSYPSPRKRYDLLKNHLAFYVSSVDSCFVNDEKVQAQEGDFYGGWITSNIRGPFKGAPGTFGW